MKLTAPLSTNFKISMYHRQCLKAEKIDKSNISPESNFFFDMRLPRHISVEKTPCMLVFY